jgi:dTDP-4-amino-4,6-dideoxygalactose transaminase
MGDFGTYSFFPSKNLGGFGDGGMLVTNDDELAEFAKVLRVHGSEAEVLPSLRGWNFRMDTLQCALLSVKVKRYAQYTAERQRNAAHYTAELSKLPGVVLADPAHCKCASAQNDSRPRKARRSCCRWLRHNSHIWNQFTLRVLGGKRDSLRDHLVAKKIGCDIYYPVTLDQQQCFAEPARRQPQRLRGGAPTRQRGAEHPDLRRTDRGAARRGHRRHRGVALRGGVMSLFIWLIALSRPYSYKRG